MNSSELYDEENTEVTKNILKIETNKEDEVLDCSVIPKHAKNSLESLVNCLQDTNKRKRTSLVCNGSANHQEIQPSVKKRGLTQEGLISNLKHRDGSPTQEDVEQPNRTKNPNVTWICEEESLNNTVMPSYKKPLYGISHKITEKKTLPGTEQFASYDLFDKVNPSSPSSLRNLNEQRKRDASNLSVLASESDPNIYSLIQKMFYTLNTLNSNMTQLHSKVDLLSLEVSRIKKHVNPIDIVADFRPPPEYQLTAPELKLLMDQSTSGADLACRLLVQLFPELFSEDEMGRACSTCGYLNKKKLESLHLQLIRNYVEVCYPSVKNPAVWQAECLPQVNDFFNSFWAQRDMENSQPDIQASSFYDTDQILGDKEDEEVLSMERSNSIVSEWVFDAQDINEFLDEASSPGEFCVFLLHRLFPELFDHRKLAERYSCYGECGKQELDPQRLQVIRRYTEIYFPAMQERKAWLQHCVQRINDELENMYMDDSESEQLRDDCCDSSLPDDVSVIKVEDSFEYERPGRRSKKIWLVPIDFDKINVPSPDFDVPIPDYLLNKEQLKNIYESSLSIGNFASRLLVHLFPELFTHENLRKQYNCSGSLGKKQLDPVRIKLIRHYVQMLYPRAKNDRVWTLEFVGKLDERCRRRDTEQRRTYQLQRKIHVPGPERRDFLTYAINAERFKEEFEGPPLPPERSNKDFCKIPLEELVVPLPDFPVPSLYLLSDKEVREIVQQSLSVGNFAARLLVRLFPELFTSDNFRLQYNHSGACNKKQLDPIRLRLIRHYVEAVYPVDKMDEVWHYECIPSIDERCRRPNRKKCDILKKAKKTKK